MMYEALVARIQYHIQKANFMGLKEHESTRLLNEAANAIEDLSKILDEEVEINTALECNMPVWIPVAERLPESGVHVLACCRVKYVGGGGRFYVCDAFYSAPKTEVCSYNDDIDAEYDEETDEYYMPEGWWEVVKNWDDYSCVAIGDFVTHWMPLPQPPESEGKT